MRTVFTFLGAFVLSLLVALVAAHQLAIHFHASEEFILVLMAIPVWVSITMLVFAVTYAAANGVGAFHIVAIMLGVLVVALVALPGLVEKVAARSTNPHTVGIENTYITLELLIPALLAVLVQWGLLRRRWLRARGAESLTLWPWITTLIGALVVLSPPGLAFIGSAINRSPTNWLRDLALMIVLAGVMVLVVMAAIECYIRRRTLRRRLSAAHRTET